MLAFTLLSRLAPKLSSTGCRRSSSSGLLPPKMRRTSALSSFLAAITELLNSLRLVASASVIAFLASLAAFATASEADLVSCMIALPTQLFRGTGIPACLWFFAKDKTAGKQGAIDRQGQVLFIDARELGYMVDRAERALTDEEIVRIGDTYHAWRGSKSAAAKGISYEDITGFCKSATLEEIKAANYVLTPGRYVGTPEADYDGEPIDDKIARLTKELVSAFDESARLEKLVRAQLELLS